MKDRRPSACDRAWANMWSQGGAAIERALREPNPKPRPVRTLADMTEDEIAQIERHYGMKVRRG